MVARLRGLGAPARLAVFAASLALVGGVAALAGATTGHAGAAAQTRGNTDSMGMEVQTSAAARSRANGLATEAAGYTLVPEQATLPLARRSVFRFRIVDARGDAVRQFDVDGGVRLHLIVVRRDFVGYQHLHPALQADGSWSVPLTLSAPGVYRAFADFDVAGQKTVLGHDLFVPGNFTPAPVPAPTSSVATDGFEVAVTHGDLRAGKETELRFAVTRNGRPVPSFQPYVGHRGHLVALRDGDLAYSHVHPLPEGAAGEIVFHTELATAGRYRLFLQFKIGGVVHTAPFTVEVQR
jgi:hypothetical protein